MLPAIETQNLTRRFGAVTALDAVSLSIAKGEFFSLLGPSGCGKTTLLRLIAGLDLPDAGALLLNGKDALSIPAHLRSVNTVFQSYALFPHLSVEDNVAFGLKMKRVLPGEITRRTRQVLEMVDIAALAARKPAQLSGGQKQRVALARAIVNEPEVLLLDEPLGALDLKLRKQLQGELRALQRRLGITFIHVTHDQEEAMAMSDRIAVMNGGRIEQLGSPGQIYDSPRTRFAAEFLGSCNTLRGSVQARDDGKIQIITPIGEFWLDGPNAARTGQQMLLTVRPENLLVRKPGGSGVAGRVIALTYNGSQTHYEIECGGQNFKACVMNNQAAETFQTGETVFVEVVAGGFRLLCDE